MHVQMHMLRVPYLLLYVVSVFLILRVYVSYLYPFIPLFPFPFSAPGQALVIPRDSPANPTQALDMLRNSLANPEQALDMIRNP